MPPIKASEADLDALTLYVLSFTGEPLSAYYVSMKTIPGPAAGRRLFEEKGCLGCHSVGGKGGNLGPALDEVAKRHDPAWIVAHFRNPQAITPGSVMPQFDFTEQETRALTEFLLSLTDTNVVGFLKVPGAVSPVERGKAVYKKYGCAGCHGADAKGGIPNPNSKTAQQVPGLKYVSEGYTKDELKKRILDGQREIPVMDPKKPPAPLYMPAWRGKIAQGELDDLVAYLHQPDAQGRKAGVLTKHRLSLFHHSGHVFGGAHHAERVLLVVDGRQLLKRRHAFPGDSKLVPHQLRVYLRTQIHNPPTPRCPHPSRQPGVRFGDQPIRLLRAVGLLHNEPGCAVRVLPQSPQVPLQSIHGSADRVHNLGGEVERDILPQRLVRRLVRVPVKLGNHHLIERLRISPRSRENRLTAWSWSRPRATAEYFGSGFAPKPPQGAWAYMLISGKFSIGSPPGVP